MTQKLHITIILIICTIGLFILNSFECTGRSNNQEQPQQMLNQYLLPRPHKIDFNNSSFQITDTTRIIYNNTRAQDNRTSKFIVDRFVHLVRDNSDYSFRLHEDKNLDELSIYLVNKADIPERFETTSEFLTGAGEQGYDLFIGKECVKVSANSYQGLLWGMMTLKQIVTSPAVAKGAVPCMQIQDKPHYIWRGFQIDAGRAPLSMGLIKRMIRICSVFKLNQVYFREGDDELNAVKYDNLPLGHKNPGALTINQIKELIDYAEKYGIDFIPEIESLGHVSAKAFHYPDLFEGGFQEEYWEGFSHTRKSHFKIDEPGSYDLLGSIYDEWFAILKTPMIHLGLDEVRLPGEKQAKHLLKLLPLADKVGQKYGKKITFLMWSDAPPVPEEYIDQTIRCLWEYGDGDKIGLENKHLLKQGLKEYSRKDCKQIVIMAVGSGSKHEPYLFTGQKRAYRNTAEWALWGKDRSNFKGIYSVQWHGNSLDLWVPNYLMTADMGWNPPEEMPDIKSELSRIRMHLNMIRDATNPNPDEVDRPVWDGIWLDGDQWGQDIMTGRKAVDKTIRLNRILSQYLQPVPRYINFKGGYFELLHDMDLIYKGDEDVRGIAERFSNSMKSNNKRLRFHFKTLEKADEHSIYLINEECIIEELLKSGGPLEKSNEQSFVLSISDAGVKVSANSPAALERGMKTLEQVLTSPVVRYAVVPGMRISDTIK